MSKKVSVGFLFDDTLDSSDGVAQHVKTLGAWLSAQGHIVSYLVGETKTTEWAGGKVYSLAKNLPVRFNGNKLSIPLPASKRRIKQVLVANKFDVLHVMMPHSPFMSQRVIKLANKNTVVVGTFHIVPSGFLSSFGSRLLRMVYGRSLRRFSAVVSVSRPAADFAKQAYSLTTKIIPNPVEISRFKVSRRPVPDGQTVVFLGRMVRRKGCAELLRAFAKVTEQMPNAKLIIAGDGPERRNLEALAKSLAIDSQTEFLGYIDEKAKPKLLAGADIACFPSLYGESFGIVLVEAMAAGAEAVLGGDNPGYRSVLGERPEALIDPKDSQAFAARILELLNNPEIRQSLRFWQQKQVKKYDISVVGPRVEDLYRQAIANRAATRHN